MSSVPPPQEHHTDNFDQDESIRLILDPQETEGLVFLDKIDYTVKVPNVNDSNYDQQVYTPPPISPLQDFHDANDYFIDDSLVDDQEYNNCYLNQEEEPVNDSSTLISGQFVESVIVTVQQPPLEPVPVPHVLDECFNDEKLVDEVGEYNQEKDTATVQENYLHYVPQEENYSAKGQANVPPPAPTPILQYHMNQQYHNVALSNTLHIQPVQPPPAADHLRKETIHWTEKEHKLFLFGLLRYKHKHKWTSVSKEFVKTRSPDQIASHAQKYFKHQDKKNRQDAAAVVATRKKRSSIHDITVNDLSPDELQSLLNDN